MTNKIKINPQEVYVWLAFKDGWHKLAGHIITIQGIKFSAVILPGTNFGNYELVFSSLESGAKFKSVNLTIFEFLNCDTKEKALTQIAESAVEVMIAIDNIGKQRVSDVIKKTEMENIAKFGEIPAIEVIENIFE